MFFLPIIHYKSPNFCPKVTNYPPDAQIDTVHHINIIYTAIYTEHNIYIIIPILPYLTINVAELLHYGYQMLS